MVNRSIRTAFASEAVVVEERRFRAMGTDAHILVIGGRADLIDQAAARVVQLEQRWSRFLPDSEVSQLNQHAGQPVTVSADTRLLVGRAVEAWRITGSSFDPTVLGAMLSAGYDRNFDDILADRPTVMSSLLLGCTDIVITDETVCLPPDTGFDAGGIGKGLAADLIVEEMVAAGATGACVNLGGDLRVAGVSPDGGGWTIAVEYPGDQKSVALIGLTDGAVATSTTVRRAWLANGHARHHLIDPQTGRPSETDVRLVTVVAGQAWMAEVLAKAVILRGSQRAFDLLDPNVADALIIDATGRVSATDGLQRFLGDTTLPTEHRNTDSP
jgi:FAD:protein FMN transferase